MCLYKYRSVTKNSLEILINRKIFLPNPSQFNDPFDGQLHPQNFMSELEELGYKNDDSQISRLEQYVSDRINTYGIYSLSNKCDDILMWSHYSDAHKGFCLGFKRDLENYFDDYDWQIRKESVRYESTHPFMNVYRDLVSNSRFNSNEKFLDYMDLGIALLEAAITIKHSSWEYEAEERIISEVKGQHSFEPEALVCIVLGMNISKEDENTIRSLLNLNPWQHVKIYRAQRSKAALSLEIIPA